MLNAEKYKDEIIKACDKYTFDCAFHLIKFNTTERLFRSK